MRYTSTSAGPSSICWVVRRSWPWRAQTSYLKQLRQMEMFEMEQTALPFNAARAISLRSAASRREMDVDPKKNTCVLEGWSIARMLIDIGCSQTVVTWWRKDSDMANMKIANGETVKYPIAWVDIPNNAAVTADVEVLLGRRWPDHSTDDARMPGGAS